MILDDYFDLQQEYEALYGAKTVVFMQIGSFYEIYEYDPALSTDKMGSHIGIAAELSVIFGIRLTQKDKSKPYTRTNPSMIGFPKVAYETYRNIAFNNGYIIVKVDQDKQNKNVTRSVASVENPNMCLDYIPQTKISSNIASVYIEYHNSGKKRDTNYGNFIITTGVSVMDVVTGKNYVCEFHSKEDDQIRAIQNLYRFLISHEPQELIIHIDQLPDEYSKTYVKYIENSLEINRFNRTKILVNKTPPEYKKLSYQTDVLNKLFTCSPSSVIKLHNERIMEDLGIESVTYGRISYILLLNFVNTHKIGLIKKLSKPDLQWIDQDKHLIMTHNAIIQLDLVSNNVTKKVSSQEIDSLMAILDKNQTNLGRRMLCCTLKNPMVDTKEIQSHHDMIEEMLSHKTESGDIMWRYFDKALKELPDISRLQRKLEIKQLVPKELSLLYRGYTKIVAIYVSIMKTSVLKHLALSQDLIREFNEFLTKYDRIFNFDSLDSCFLDVLESGKKIFEFNEFPIKLGNYSDIDPKIKDLDDSIQKLQSIVDHLNDVLPNNKQINFKEGKKKRGANKQGPVGVMIIVSNPKSTQILQSNYDKKICGTLTATPCNTSEKIITSNEISELCERINNIKSWLRERLINVYDTCLDDMNAYKFYSHIANLIAKLDMIHSYAKVAHSFNYFKPDIIESENSFFDATEIRHPIIERIIETEYVTNDVALKNSGMLLYGVNSTGKSSLSKAVVLNTIMAQAGSYVPSHLKLSPYAKIITSLTSDDNMQKNMSSFNVEMAELRTILRQADEKTLVITDELSSSTEITSAKCITSTAVKQLTERNSSFIFSTHIHELTEISIIKDLPAEKLKISHLTVNYDDNLGKLIFDRKLKNGSGPPIYGLIVLKSMDFPQDFLDMANKIMLELMGENPEIVNTSTSKYNKEVYMDACVMCNKTKNLHAHHLKEQHLADHRNLIGNIHKNIKGNLVVLCDKCHQKLHAKNEKIVNLDIMNGKVLVHCQ